jgi:hypothetical protein
MHDIFGVEELIAPVGNYLGLVEDELKVESLALGELDRVQCQRNQVAAGLMCWLALPDCLRKFGTLRC